MCKYCEFTYVDDEIGERSNEVQDIKRIREGHYVLDLRINRYECDDCKNTELILETLIDLDKEDGLHIVTEEHINITYCPFCGEKL